MAEIMPSEKYLPNRKFQTLLREQDRQKRLQLALPVPKIRRCIPWGYILDPEDDTKTSCIPVEKAFLCLIRAKEFLKESSYLDVSNWLKSCGYPISHQGLFRLMNERPPFDEVLLPLEERMKLV